MNDWELLYEGFDPAHQGLRETLCTLGNGYFATRGAAPDALAGDVHYPGTYLAGGYNRLTTQLAGREVENEDLVNVPNWLVLAIRIDGGPWLDPDQVEYLDYRQNLDLKHGVLHRSLRLRDPHGRELIWEERRIVSMANPHLAALEIRLTPQGWSGRIGVRSAIDGGVTNSGVQRYRAMNGRHLETLEVLETGEARVPGEARAVAGANDDAGGGSNTGEQERLILLRSRMVQSRREIVLAARTRVCREGERVLLRQSTDAQSDAIAQIFECDATHGKQVSIEKVVALHTSRDAAISEPSGAALEQLANADAFDAILREHSLAWRMLWDACDIEIESRVDAGEKLKLHLHIFHLLQTVSVHSVDLDTGMPPRGWHGEAYRGHVMWDELFIFPYLNLHRPTLTRALLLYRFRRLDEARRAASAAGFRGAMYPWQSGSNGREETQKVHLNPLSGRWIPDNSNRQRHINAAIALNIWTYYEVTEDRQFLYAYGAEMLFEIARFWASLASYDESAGRYAIRGVMGPDEFHTAYPGKDPTTQGGIDNNAYTNVMVSWSLMRALDVLDLLPQNLREELCARLDLGDDELALWDDVSRRLAVPFFDDGIIGQFEGYETLDEFDWDGYRAKYGDIHRLDRILEQEGEDPNRYKVSKQADVLMLFFIFSTEELTQVFERLGYDFTPDMIFRNINYYAQRTSHGSTLSWVTHAWVLARSDRERSWHLFRQALDSDFADLQGGTTPEGIHMGAMAGTVDLIQRCYTGAEPRANVLTFNPRLPDELIRLRTTFRYRGHTLDLDVSHDTLKVSSRPFTAYPITIAYRGHVREVSPGQSYAFRLVPPKPQDRPGKDRAREELRQRRHESVGTESNGD